MGDFYIFLSFKGQLTQKGPEEALIEIICLALVLITFSNSLLRLFLITRVDVVHSNTFLVIAVWVLFSCDTVSDYHVADTPLTTWIT